MFETANKKTKVLALLGLSLTCAAQAHKTSATLPKGIFRARVVNVYGDPVLNKFGSTGDRRELLAPLERKIDTATLAASNADLKQLYDGLNSFEPGLGDDLYAAQLMADAKLNFHQITTAVEFGLTDRISLGVIVPFVKMDGSASFDANVTTKSAAVKEKVKGTMLEDGVTQFESQIPRRNELAAALFTQNGYQIPGEFSYSGLGDIEIGGLVSTYKNDTITSGIQAGVRLPTSTHKKDYSNILDQGTGDEQLDIAIEAGLDAQVTSGLLVGFHSRYTMQLGRKTEMPVLKNGASGLPNLNDPSSWVIVDRNLGDLLENEVYLDYTFNKAWSPYVAYTYSLWGSDQYSGPAGYDYAGLAADSAGSSHSIMVGMTFSTISGYVAKKVPVPFKIDVSYNRILSARNATDASYGRLDLIVFF